MAIGWSERRQVLYYLVAFAILAVLLVAAWRVFFVKTPTCFDRTKNNDEKGVDCGGSCALICAETAKTPTVLWARSFETAPHIYTAAAYIQNNNVAENGATKQVRYTFQIFDNKNVLIVERQGVLDIPPQQIVPIVESQIDVGTRVPARTFFEFDDEPMVWHTIPAASIPTLKITGSRLENGRLSTTISNESLIDAKKVTVVAVLFDLNGVARAAAKTTLSKLSRKSSENLTFSWPNAESGYTFEVKVVPSF
jgi:hypothetical protein